MKHIQIIVLIMFFLGGGIRVFAQGLMMFKRDRIESLHMNPGTIKDSTQIDKTLFSAVYRFTNRTIKRSTGNAWCDILLQAGEQFVKQVDLCMYYDNIMYTKRVVDPRLSALRDGVANHPSNLFIDMLYDRQIKELFVVCGDLFRSDTFKSYSQTLPKLFWQMLEGQQVINGYTCNEAITNFGGREWHVWYTPDIPLSFGPWKLAGLPGLILSASSGEEFSFECIALDQESKPLMKYTYRSLQDLKTRERYLRYERNCHEHPYDTFANGQPATVVLGKSDGSIEYLNRSWTIPYNPIELE